MDKNENGIPSGTLGDCCLCQSPSVEDGCGGSRPSCANLGYLSAPSQRFAMLYSAAEALSHGTLFEELYLPMEVYGRE